jgi:hypothetical protein
MEFDQREFQLFATGMLLFLLAAVAPKTDTFLDKAWRVIVTLGGAISIWKALISAFMR